MSAPVESVVSFFASPPSIESRYTCEFPSRDDRNASAFPSGDQAGELSCPLCVNCIASPPAVLTIHTLLAFRFASISGVDTANATHLPSPETCGAETRCNLIMSSNVIACFAPCALSEPLSTSVTTTAHPALNKFIVISFILRKRQLNILIRHG